MGEHCQTGRQTIQPVGDADTLSASWPGSCISAARCPVRLHSSLPLTSHTRVTESREDAASRHRQLAFIQPPSLTCPDFSSSTSVTETSVLRGPFFFFFPASAGLTAHFGVRHSIREPLKHQHLRGNGRLPIEDTQDMAAGRRGLRGRQQEAE